MATLWLIGTGLGARGISVEGLDRARACATILVEAYTAVPPDLEPLVGAAPRLTRHDVEGMEPILRTLEHGDVALLVPGDPLAATTHTMLRLEIPKRGHAVRVIHGASILTAAPGLSGLSPYKFGRVVTLVRPVGRFFPTSPVELMLENRRAGLHTLMLLDITPEGPMRVLEAARGLRDCLGRLKSVALDGAELLAVCGAGVDDIVVRGTLDQLERADLPGTMHCLIVPAAMSEAERDAVTQLVKRL